MAKTLKFWTGLGIAAVSGTIVAEAATLDAAVKPLKEPSGKSILLADSSGEAGESGGLATGDDRSDYLKDLGLVEGHMLAGVALYKAGDLAAAKTHMKHPGDEIYAELMPHFARLGVKGFADELEAVAKSIEANATAGEVDRLMAELHAEIVESRSAALTARETAKVISLLLREAAEDYEKGIKEGQVADAHEYQDAWGFTQSAKSVLADLAEAEREEHPGPIGEITAELAKAEAVFPDVSGKQAGTADSSVLAIAASNVELIASSIK